MQVENLNQFQESINLFYASRLIIVERDISNMLRVLVGRPDYFQIIGECAKAAIFKGEYKRAISSSTNVEKFLLPNSDCKIVSLVTGLLFEFDKNNISIVDFVTSFFPADKPHESYIKFCDNIIKPFEKSFKNIYLGLIDSGETESTEVPEGLIPLVDKAKEDCDYWLRKMIDTIIGDNSIPESLRNDSLKLLHGLLYVLDINNPVLINIVWTGVDRTLSNVSSCYRELRELEQILKSYGAIG